MFHSRLVRHAPWVRVGVVCAAAASSVNPASAQTALDAVVVTATREPQSLARVTADVVVIDREAIERSSADSIEDLLRRAAGVQLSRTGGPGQSAGIFIRGTGASSTVVLIDGVRVGSATLGQVEFESIGLSQIDHIEILRGPGSSLYGADAIGGVVQIFTRQGRGSPRVSAHVAVGGYGSSEGDVNLSGSAVGVDYAAGIGRERSRGVSSLLPGDPYGNYNPDRDGYGRTTGQLRLGYTPVADHRIGLNFVKSQLNAQYDGAQYLAPDFNPDATPDFRSHLDSQVASLDYRGRISDLWRTTVQLARNDDELKAGASVIAAYETRRDQFTWQNALTLAPGHQLVAAYERLNEHAQTGGFDQRRHNNGFVLGYAGTVATHSLQADLRHDDNSVYGGVTTGRLGWALDLLPGLRVRAVAGTSFRAPSFNDLYYPSYGVATVRPEKGKSIELGVNWESGDSRASATIYRNTVRELISYQSDRAFCPVSPDHPYPYGCAGNVGHARLQGATLSGGRRWGGLSVDASIDFLDAKNTDTGQRLQRRAAHQESVAADYEFGAWSFGAALLGLGSRPDSGARLGGYATLDLKARWRFAAQWQLEAKLLNATDRNIEPARYYQGLGRQAWLGIRFDGQGL